MKRREIMKINEEELCEIVKEYLIEEGKRLQEVLSFVMKDKIIKKKEEQKEKWEKGMKHYICEFIYVCILNQFYFLCKRCCVKEIDFKKTVI